MKRYSPILFIWLSCLLLSGFVTLETYLNGKITEALAWGTATVFMSNLVVYHLYSTRNEKKKDSNILDE